MPIKIVDEPNIHLTRAEWEKLQAEWKSTLSFHANPMSFENWLRTRKAKQLIPERLPFADWLDKRAEMQKGDLNERIDY